MNITTLNEELQHLQPLISYYDVLAGNPFEDLGNSFGVACSFDDDLPCPEENFSWKPDSESLDSLRSTHVMVGVKR